MQVKGLGVRGQGQIQGEIEGRKGTEADSGLGAAVSLDEPGPQLEGRGGTGGGPMKGTLGAGTNS